MKVQFLNSGSDYRARGGGGVAAKVKKDDGLFWWTILITLLLGLATFCWFFSIMVFKYPEKPFHYRLLTKLEKLEEIKSFDPLSVPHGPFLGAKDLLAKYYQYNPEQLSLANAGLKRSYIMNYMGEAPVYVKGTYEVILSRPLTGDDLINEGWVVKARSVDLEDVQIELILPGAPAAATPYQAGDKFTLDNKNTFSTAVHVERNMETDGVCVTVVPIAYGQFKSGSQQGITLKPPGLLNMEAHLPLTAQDEAPEMPVVAKISE